MPQNGYKMTNKKSILLLICLLLGISICAQTKDTLLLKNPMFNFNTPNFTRTDNTFGLKNIDFQKNASSLFLYNSTTNLYDTYINDGSTYIYSNSTIFFENKSNIFIDLYLGNNSFMESNSLMQNTSFILDKNATYWVRDSFNPYGAANMREALVGGVLGLLFNQ